MKLIPLILFISIAVDVKSNEQFTFPPKYHLSNSGIIVSSDSSIYLPPESHTSAPYYPMKNVNNLPFPYLPHTGTKAALMIPTHYPLVISSTLLPIHNDDEDEDDESEKQSSAFHIQKNNRTERGKHEIVQRRDQRSKFTNYQAVDSKPVNFQPIDRIDMKPPFGFINNPPTLTQHQHSHQQQKATPRSMIISTEQHRNDAIDQLRAAAATYQGPQYLPAPNAPGVYISSTTETAIPILRLSNEMDLDGSFSYEALGADQTHYVQHSRMENTGTDKEEQVVEGSYSYVGDNGQTYTVHYVADSKGFRASGDHLPVAPPIPEIIQRAVQFNLAEEAKRPPNQKSWNEEKENEISESERYQRFVMPPTARPLFTGKSPESFSFGFAQGAYNTPNLTPAASTQNPARTNNDFTQDQMKSIVNNGNNAGIISPQVTFLASQGAHVPAPITQQSISRVFTTERTLLPQIVNYEAAIKEEPLVDLSENKGLWRWQYGLNANANQAPEKNTISRSSGMGDDVIINFGEMTPEQYTKMLNSQLEPNMKTIQADQIAQPSNEMKIYKEPNHNTKVHNGIKSDPKLTIVPVESGFISSQIPDLQKNINLRDQQPYNNPYKYTENLESKPNDNLFSSRSKLITHNTFVPQSQMITQSYDYEDSSYEPKRINRYSTTRAPESLSYSNYNNLKMKDHEQGTQNSLWSDSNQIENIQRVFTTDVPISTTMHNIQFIDFVNGNKDDFKPIVPSHEAEKTEEPINTTEAAVDIFQSNLFLKNLLQTNKNVQYTDNTLKEENKIYQQQTKSQLDRKPDKSPKFIQVHAKPHNDIKEMQKKPLDLLDIMNYISAKNHFESIKVKPKSKYVSNNYNHRSEIRFIPVQNDRENTDDIDDGEENMDHSPINHRTSYHPEELQGIIKNYKVLQRNNSANKNEQDFEQLRRDLSPPPVKMLQSNLPPLGRAGPSVKTYMPPLYV